jgi:Adenylate and Guanylate cyclase catalytic domain
MRNNFEVINLTLFLGTPQTVNTAARMESTGESNRIQVSQKTADQIRLAGKGYVACLTPLLRHHKFLDHFLTLLVLCTCLGAGSFNAMNRFTAREREL